MQAKYTTYFNTLLFPVIATVRAMNNILGKNRGSDIHKESKLENNLLQKFFSSEKVLLPTTSLPIGVSLLLIAKEADEGNG